MLLGALAGPLVEEEVGGVASGAEREQGTGCLDLDDDGRFELIFFHRRSYGNGREEARKYLRSPAPAAADCLRLDHSATEALTA
jgi:hypothetical protein